MPDNNQIISASIQVDTGNSTAVVQSLNKETGKLKENLKDTSKEVDSSTGNFTKLKGQIEGLPGPIGSTTQQAGKLNTALKALAANPLALALTIIVGALTILYKALASTAEGADKIEQVMSGLGAVVEVIAKRILSFGSAIVNFFKGNWKQAAADAKGAFAGFGEEVAKEFRTAANAMRELQAVEDATRDLSVSRAKLNRDLAATKELLTDENATLDQKRKAIDAVRKAEGEQTEQELKNAERKLQALQKKAGVDVSDQEADAIAAQQAEVYRLQQESATNQRSLNKQSRAIEKEAAAKAKEERDKQLSEQKEQYQKYVEFTNKLTQLKQDNELLTIKDGYAKEQKELEFKYQNEKAALEKSLKEGQITRAQFKQLSEALDLKGDLEKQALVDKHNQEVKEKEEAFQKELSDIATRVKLKGITDSRELERTQLQLGYEERLNEAIKRYKDDQDKFNAAKALIDEEFEQDKAKLDEKYATQDFEKSAAKLAQIYNDNAAELEARKAALDADVALTEDAYKRKLITEDDYLAKKKGFAKAESEIDNATAENRNKILDVVAKNLSNFGDLVGKQTALGKAASIAETAIHTYQSATAAYKSMAGIPIVGPVLGGIAAAAAIKSGLDNVKRITAIQVPGSKGGGVSVSTPVGVAAPLAPKVAGMKLNQDDLNALGNYAQGGVNKQPIKTYVLSSDIQNDADRNARLERAARLGG
jgi:hypothetical protein